MLSSSSTLAARGTRPTAAHRLTKTAIAARATSGEPRTTRRRSHASSARWSYSDSSDVIVSVLSRRATGGGAPAPLSTRVSRLAPLLALPRVARGVPVPRAAARSPVVAAAPSPSAALRVGKPRRPRGPRASGAPTTLTRGGSPTPRRVEPPRPAAAAAARRRRRRGGARRVRQLGLHGVADRSPALFLLVDAPASVRAPNRSSTLLPRPSAVPRARQRRGPSKFVEMFAPSDTPIVAHQALRARHRHPRWRSSTAPRARRGRMARRPLRTVPEDVADYVVIVQDVGAPARRPRRVGARGARSDRRDVRDEERCPRSSTSTGSPTGTPSAREADAPVNGARPGGRFARARQRAVARRAASNSASDDRRERRVRSPGALELSRRAEKVRDALALQCNQAAGGSSRVDEGGARRRPRLKDGLPRRAIELRPSSPRLLSRISSPGGGRRATIDGSSGNFGGAKRRGGVGGGGGGGDGGAAARGDGVDDRRR